MSLSMMQAAVRITDHFYGVEDTDTYERQGRLQNAVILVFTMHLMLAIAFVQLEKFDLAHPKIIHDVDVTFEFTPPPPPPKPIKLSNSLSLTAGENPAPGSEAAPKPLNMPEPSMPAVKAPATAETPRPLPARPVPSRRKTLAAPVAVTPNNIVKAALPTSAPSQAQVVPKPSVIAGAAVSRVLSGKETAGGAPGSHDAGTGTGGQGAGGGGAGAGDAGAGTGFGPAGVPIAMRLPVTRAMGNIGPYRKDLLLRLAQNWHPKKSYEELMVLITLNHEGQLMGSEIFQSSGHKKADKEALAAVKATEFAPLPDWYKGKTLTFKIQLSKVEAATQ